MKVYTNTINEVTLHSSVHIIIGSKSGGEMVILTLTNNEKKQTELMHFIANLIPILLSPSLQSLECYKYRRQGRQQMLHR